MTPAGLNITPVREMAPTAWGGVKIGGLLRRKGSKKIVE